jgi:hypothetical protein
VCAFSKDHPSKECVCTSERRMNSRKKKKETKAQPFFAKKERMRE